MLKIRLLRIGRKHQPSYKIVVVDQRRAPKSGKFVEQVGFYNPITKERGFKKERIEYWLSKGAQVSDTLYNLLITEGIIKGKKKKVHSSKKKGKEEVPAEESKEEKPGMNKSQIKEVEQKEEQTVEKPKETEKPKEEPSLKEEKKEKKSEETEAKK